MLGWELPPHNSGGLGVACLQLCRSLSKKGAHITFVVPYTAKHNLNFMNVISARIADVVSITGVYDSAEYREESDMSLKGSVYDIQNRYVEAIAKMDFGKEFDVIHAHDWLTFRAGLRAKELLGKPLILHVHSIESDRAGGKSGNPLVHEIEYLSFLLADKIVAVSELTRKKIINEYEIAADKIIVAHNSIDFGDMQDLDQDNSYKLLLRMKANGYKVIGNVGRITIQKGLSNLLISAQKVIEREPKTIFLIVGSGDQLRDLIKFAAHLGISQNVIFADFQRGKNLRDAFGIIDLFVMPSVSEPFGLTPLEAAFYGTPSLVSKQSGVAEVLKNCLKVDFWDTDKMADQIVSFVRNDSLGKSLLSNVCQELQKMSWDRSADILMQAYQKHKGVVV